MKYNIQTKLYRMAIRLEVLVGICILIAVAAATLGLLADIHIPTILSSPESLQAYLTTAMTIIIGVEFVKMIFSYTIDTVIEVMLLAVAPKQNRKIPSKAFTFFFFSIFTLLLNI